MRTRVYRAYDMMVDFYGFMSADQENGELHRNQLWQERLQNLNRQIVLSTFFMIKWVIKNAICIEHSIQYNVDIVVKPE